MLSPHQGQHTLIVNSGPNVGQTYVLHDMVSTLGRSADNTIVLDSTRVSRYHVKITILPDGAVIEDTGSTNGTFVNGQQITTQYQLSAGDIIGVADYISFQYIHEDIGGSSTHSPVFSTGSTQIMGGPGGAETGQMGSGSPHIPTHTPDYASSAFVPHDHPNMQPSIMPVKNDKKRPTTLYVIIAVLVVFICLCVALAIFLWFAPETFWRDLFDFFNIPWPSTSMLIQLT